MNCFLFRKCLVVYCHHIMMHFLNICNRCKLSSSDMTTCVNLIVVWNNAASWFFSKTDFRILWNHVSQSALCLSIKNKIYQMPMTNAPPALRLVYLQQNYLMNFGYLPKTDIETGNLRSESQLIDAIKRLQVWMSLKLFFFIRFSRSSNCNNYSNQSHSTFSLHHPTHRQTLGNIPATGVIDDSTKRLMIRPRCGLPDTDTAIDFYADNSYRKNRHRAKRFVILGRKWDKTDLTWRWVL